MLSNSKWMICCGVVPLCVASHTRMQCQTFGLRNNGLT